MPQTYSSSLKEQHQQHQQQEQQLQQLQHHQHRQSLPSFRQFVHQTHSPETPQSCRFTSSAHDRRHSLPSFGQLVAQIQDLEERQRLPSLTDFVAGTPVALPWRGDQDMPLFYEHEDDGQIPASDGESTLMGTLRQQYQSKVDSISILAAAAAEIERDTDHSGAVHEYGQNSIQFPSTYNQSPTTSTASSFTDVSAKMFPRGSATHRSSSSSGNSSGSSRSSSSTGSSSQNSTWLWRHPTDNRWVQHKQTSPPKRDRPDDYQDHEMVAVKQEDEEDAHRAGLSMTTKRPHVDLPYKKRKSSLTFPHLASSRGNSSGSSSRVVKRSTESMTDETRSELQSEGDDHYHLQQPRQQHPAPQSLKVKKKRMSKPKDPNHVSPAGFRHGGERRVQEPDEVVEIPADVGPLSMLEASNFPKVTWKGTPLPVDGKPGAERLHPHEAEIASTLRLSPAQYLLCKKTLILASREFQSNHKVFRKTDAQKLCHVDVNKASKLWEVFTRIGWLAGNTDEDV
ncbi:hypothetical protein DFQ27_004007 [Actinomortierella ambigua]|uniref:SWIRM domain-containing protein n=1 Tax=Actinomortierella ambigua TaxID=1343610 RepID=A0A9P6QK94_9FUNG|nr:hypothetical protein DFQ27_004007 [Actinomortierella ambigua]